MLPQDPNETIQDELQDGADNAAASMEEVLESLAETPQQDTVESSSGDAEMQAEAQPEPEASETEAAPVVAEPVEETPVGVETELQPEPEDAAPAAEAPEAEPAAATNADPQPEPEPEADAPAETLEVAHVSADEAQEVAETELEVSETFSEADMMAQIDAILSSENNLEQLVAGATPAELILILERFAQQEEVGPNIKRVGLIKRSFDALSKSENPPSSLLQARFSTALSRFNKKRSEYQQAVDAQRDGNSVRKREIVAQLRAVVEVGDGANIDEVRRLQDEWRATGPVRKEDSDALNQEFKHLQDQFYEQRTLFNQMREYDRQINLQRKEKLLEELKRVIPNEEERDNRDIWQDKNDLFNSLLTEWKSIGQIPRDDMERIRQSYQESVDEYLLLRREFYETLDQEKQENADKKSELLARMEQYLSFVSDKPQEWNKATEALRVLQEEWKEIGRAPKEVNSELWKQFRNIGNTFFVNKSEFFKKLDGERIENLERKRKLCEEAEALKDSVSWEKDAREVRRMQEEWKAVGPVPDRYSNKLWNRFRSACDDFFNRRREHYDSLREDEQLNLERKRELIAEVKLINLEEIGSIEKAIEMVKEIQERWKAIGRVPIKEKDSIWEEFRAEVDSFFDDLRNRRESRGPRPPRENREGRDNRERRDNRDRGERGDRGDRAERGGPRRNEAPDDKRTSGIRAEIGKTLRKIDASKTKIDTYSTNILYISKGKSGDALRNQIQKEIDKEEKVLKGLQRELSDLQAQLHAPQKEEKAAAAAPAVETPAVEAPENEAPAEETIAAEAPAESPAAEAETPEAPAQDEPVDEQLDEEVEIPAAEHHSEPGSAEPEPPAEEA